MAALSVALICAKVPVMVTVAVPLLAMLAVPPETATVPWATAKVTVRVPVPASTSAMLRPVMVRAVSSLVVSVVKGTVLTGASLTALTVMAMVSESVKVPPLPVLPPSLVSMVNVSLPL